MERPGPVSVVESVTARESVSREWRSIQHERQGKGLNGRSFYFRANHFFFLFGSAVSCVPVFSAVT